MSDIFGSILEDIKDLSNELEKGNISYRINSNRYEGAFKVTIEAINLAVNNLIEDSLYIVDRIKDFGIELKILGMVILKQKLKIFLEINML